MGKRIWQYPEATSISENDYLLLDNQTDGSKSIKANLVGSILIDKTVTERKTYTAADDNVDGYKKVIVDVPYTDVHYQKGDIVTFDDGEDLPLASLKTTIVPIQDLHGYDSPWVGGAGKNKWGEGISTTPDVSGLYGGWYIPYNSKATIILFDKGTTVDLTGVYLGMSDNGITAPVGWLIDNGTATSSGKFTSTSYHYVTIYPNNAQTLEKIFAKYNVMCVVDGADETAYAPYSNICPISGWSEANVSVCGVNRWDEEWENGWWPNGVFTPNASAICSKGKISVKPNLSYYVVTPQGETMFYSLYDINGNLLRLSGADSYGRFSNVSSFVFNCPDNVYYITFNMSSAYGNTYNSDISINYPSTDTSYHAYNGTTYTIPFTDAQGNPITVFGGTLDVVSGTIGNKKTLGSVDMGDINWSYGSGIFYANNALDNAKTPTTTLQTANLMSEIYKTTSDSNIISTTYAVSLHPSGQLCVNNPSYSDAQTFKTAMNGVKLVYELATPSTFISQPTSIKSLEGENNVWGDCGPVAVEWQTLYVTPTE